MTDYYTRRLLPTRPEPSYPIPQNLRVHDSVTDFLQRLVNNLVTNHGKVTDRVENRIQVGPFAKRPAVQGNANSYLDTTHNILWIDVGTWVPIGGGGLLPQALYEIVTDYGVIGDGSDAAVSQLAVDAAEVSGKPVYFPALNYLFETDVELFDGCILVGPGVPQQPQRPESGELHGYWATKSTGGTFTVPTEAGFDIQFTMPIVPTGAGKYHVRWWESHATDDVPRAQFVMGTTTQWSVQVKIGTTWYTAISGQSPSSIPLYAGVVVKVTVRPGASNCAFNVYFDGVWKRGGTSPVVTSIWTQSLASFYWNGSGGAGRVDDIYVWNVDAPAPPFSGVAAILERDGGGPLFSVPAQSGSTPAVAMSGLVLRRSVFTPGATDLVFETAPARSVFEGCWLENLYAVCGAGAACDLELDDCTVVNVGEIPGSGVWGGRIDGGVIVGSKVKATSGGNIIISGAKMYDAPEAAVSLSGVTGASIWSTLFEDSGFDEDDAAGKRSHIHVGASSTGIVIAGCRFATDSLTRHLLELDGAEDALVRWFANDTLDGHTEEPILATGTCTDGLVIDELDMPAIGDPDGAADILSSVIANLHNCLEQYSAQYTFRVHGDRRLISSCDARRLFVHGASGIITLTIAAGADVLFDRLSGATIDGIGFFDMDTRTVIDAALPPSGEQAGGFFLRNKILWPLYARPLQWRAWTCHGDPPRQTWMPMSWISLQPVQWPHFESTTPRYITITRSGADYDIKKGRTLEFWTQPDEVASLGYRYIFDDGKFVVMMDPENGAIRIVYTDAAMTVHVIDYQPPETWRRLWNPWQISLDDVTSNLTLRRFGEDCVVYAMGANDVGAPGGASIYIGADITGANGFHGGIADLRIWDTVRDGSDHKDDSTLRLAGTETDLAGYWPAEEGSGATVDNKVSGGNDGSLVSPEWMTAE